MIDPRTQIILQPALKLALKELADEKDVSVSKLVREALVKTYFKRKKLDLTRQSFFGAWKDIKKTDKEILDETGGNWSGFPLE